MENLYELLEEAAHKVPTKGIVIVNNSQCDLFLTYSELREKSRKIAFILKSYYQVKPVSKIIISVEKSENFILLFWGCVMAGCIPVLMPSVQFSNKNSIAFERLKNAIDILGVVTLITNDINLFEYYKSSFHKAVCVEDIMKQLDLLQDYSLHIPKRDSKDLCVIQFSSGSTGAPKGVMLSFNNILTNLKIKTLADEITTEDTLIHWMPYFHDYGLFGNHLVCLYNQITEIKIEPFSFLRDPLIFLKKISEYQVSICGGTTPSGLDLLIQKLEQSNDIKELDLSQVKTLSIGAEMVPSNLYVRLSPLFQLGFNRNAFRPSYGMAETTLIVSSCLPGYGNKNIRINREAFYEGIIKLVDKQQDFCEFVSAGRILPGLQVRIVKDGIPQNNLNLGEIQVKGACVMSGYYNDIQSTDEVLKDGWLSTGDLGFFDYNNILYIVGRKKETIIVNGQNFHPFDLENCVLEKFGLSIEKTVFTSFYSSTENREIVLHFFVLSRKMSEEQIRQLINENLEKLGGFECKSYTILNAPKLKRIDEKLYIGVAASKVGSINAQEILNGLSAITYVGKDLRIDCSGIESFEPLRNLSFVGGDLIFDIGGSERNNLQSFTGFESLTTIGGRLIWGTGVSSAGSVSTYTSFSNIQSFQGFNNLSSIGGFRMSINYGDFSKFTSFAGLENLRQIKGDFTIEIEDSFWGLSDISALTNLETVEGSEFKIKGCYKLKDFTPLKQALTSYQGTFLTYSNGYNPTKEQILNGEGKQ